MIHFPGQFTCPGHYRCHNSTVCTSLGDVCDGIPHCPSGDDEWHCRVQCPLECTCTDLIYICSEKELVSLPEGINSGARKLDLGNNRMNIGNSTFMGFFWLGELVLTNNTIQRFATSAFSDLVNLYSLDLSDNKLVYLQARLFQNLRNLVDLNLLGNVMLARIEPGAFLGLARLPYLRLTGMSISYLDDNVFMGLKQLERLRLDDNSMLGLKDNTFGKLTKVVALNISLNRDLNIPKSALEPLVSLAILQSDDFKYCCFVKEKVSEEHCLPKRDEFSSCEDLMRRPVLKAFLWILGLMAFLCNLVVLVWRAKEKMTVYSLCVMNLAVADFLMGLYMTILASVDAYYSGVYIQYADQWKKCWLCQILGFLKTFSSEASVFSLCVISADRFYKIVYPFKGSKFGIKQGRIALVFLWVMAFLISAAPFLPLSYFDGEFYSRSSVCLSLHITNKISPGWEYSVAVFHALNFSCFMFIFCAYLYIYVVVRRSREDTLRQSTRPPSADVALARRLVLVVATDFVCWIPINIMG